MSITVGLIALAAISTINKLIVLKQQIVKREREISENVSNFPFKVSYFFPFCHGSSLTWVIESPLQVRLRGEGKGGT
jgi:hypothetical protein